MCHTTPPEVTEALSKLSKEEQILVNQYITKLQLDSHSHNGESSNEEMLPMYDVSTRNNDTDSSSRYKNTANDYKSNGDYELALEHYTKAILASPPSALLLANRAGVSFQLQNYKAAIQDCNIALEKNSDSAKALRIRGRSYKMLQEWEKSRSDLSTSQTIDYDSSAVEDLKEVTEKVMELEKEKVKLKLKEDDDKRKELEERKKKKEGEKKEKANKPTGGMAGMMGSLFNDPEIASSLQNPKVQEALSSMMSGGGLDMSKIQQCMSDPEVAPVFQKLMKKMGPMMGGMGGMGGMSGAGGMDSNSVPDINDIPDL